MHYIVIDMINKKIINVLEPRNLIALCNYLRGSVITILVNSYNDENSELFDYLEDSEGYTVLTEMELMNNDYVADVNSKLSKLLQDNLAKAGIHLFSGLCINCTTYFGVNGLDYLQQDLQSHLAKNACVNTYETYAEWADVSTRDWFTNSVDSYCKCNNIANGDSVVEINYVHKGQWKLLTAKYDSVGSLAILALNNYLDDSDPEKGDSDFIKSKIKTNAFLYDKEDALLVGYREDLELLFELVKIKSPKKLVQ